MELMTAQTQTIRSISIFPYYRGVPLEVDAVAHATSGRYQSGFFAGQSYYTLDLDDAQHIQDLHVGATYTCTALGKDDKPLRTHWLFCTAVAPVISFGISKHWSNPFAFAAILPQIDNVIVHLEALTDLVAVFPPSVHDSSLSQAQIGQTGWLVMTRIGCPHMIGILVDDPILPTSMCLGSSGHVIAARSVRTTQSISLDSLSCVSARDSALFLRMDD